MLALNDDSLRNISDFLAPLELIRTSKFGCKIASWRFPRKVILRGLHEIRQFERLCRLLDTVNLVDVTMFTDFWDKSTEVIGWVPSSVKTLSIDNYIGCAMHFLNIPDGVQNLTIGKCRLEYIDIPDSVINLTLNTRFEGSLRVFPPNLQMLTIQNWSWLDYPHEHSPPIPDTVREIYIGTFVPFNIFQWPESLEKLTVERCNFVHLPDYPSVPEGVEYNLIGEPDDFGGEEEEQWWDDEYSNSIW